MFMLSNRPLSALASLLSTSGYTYPSVGTASDLLASHTFYPQHPRTREEASDYLGCCRDHNMHEP